MPPSSTVAPRKPIFGTTTGQDIAYDLVRGSVENVSQSRSAQVVCPAQNHRTEGAPRVRVNVSDRNPAPGANVARTLKSVREDGFVSFAETRSSNSSFTTTLPIEFVGRRFSRANRSVYLFCTLPPAVDGSDLGRSEIVNYKISP